MINAAERMKLVGRSVSHEGGSPSIFGSAGSLAQSIESGEAYRIALYPIVCDEMPDAAMGVAACLGYLLEQWEDVKVYRCFARIEDGDADEEISTKDYQFGPGEWELRGLDDNIIMSGALTFRDSSIALELRIDASMIDGEAQIRFAYSEDSLGELISRLPAIAGDIASNGLGLSGEQIRLGYEEPAAHEEDLQSLLEEVFGWNLDVYLDFWDVAWDAEDIEAQFLSVARLCRKTEDDFAFWCLGMMAGQVMQAGLEELGDAVGPLVEEAFSDADARGHGTAAAARGLGRLGYIERAHSLFERRLAAGADASVWHEAVNTCMDSGRAEEAIELCQRGLEAGLEHPALYWRYAELLMLSQSQEWEIEEVLLIDPDDVDASEEIACEIISALKLLLKFEPENLHALYLALMTMIDVDDADLWDYFGQLARRDVESDYVGEVIGRLVERDELEPAYGILQKVVKEMNGDARAYVNLAELALVDENIDYAKQALLECRESNEAVEGDVELDLQRLELSVEKPDFEQRFAEIKVMLNAERMASESDVALLEEAVDIAPKMVDLHLTLSRCYLGWRDRESAEEVLNDAIERAGWHPKIALSMAQLQWNRMQRAEAIDTLNDAIEAFPNDVALLAQIASYLIENGQLDDARQFVERAESIAPTHRELQQIRRFIAAKIAE